MTEPAPPLFSPDAPDSALPDNALIERRLYWLVGWHMQRRGQALSRQVGLARNTLRAYGDARPFPKRTDGRAGRRLATLMDIMTALDIDWVAANLAAAQARSADDMLGLAVRYGGVRQNPDLLCADRAGAR